MAEDVIIRYRAEVDELTQKVNAVISQQEKLAATQNKTQKELNETTTSVKKLETELSNTGQSFKKAEAGAKGFGQTVSKEIKPLGGVASNIGLQIAGAFAAAFSVQQVIAFGTAAVNAFIEAEKNAQQLKFAVVDVGKETEGSFDRLVRQSERLQEVTIFSDDSIQQAQKALTTFGLTSDQIDVIIPKILDFATITGKNLPEAIQAFGSGLQGMGRDFKKFDIEVSASKSTLENFTILSEGFEKFAGASGKALETTSGKIARFKNNLDDFMEGVGGFLVGAASNFVQGIRNMGDEVQSFLASLGFERVESSLGKTADSFDAFRAQVSESLLSASNIEEFDRAANQFLESATQGVDKRLQVIQGLERNLDQAKSRAVVNQKEIFAIQTAIDKERDTNLKNEQLRLALVNEVIDKLRLKFTETTKPINDVREATDKLVNSLDKINPEQAEKLLSALQKIDLARTSGSIADFRDVVGEASKEVNDQVTKDFEESLKKQNEARVDATKEVDDDREDTLKKEQELNDAILASTEQTVSTIAGFYSDFLDGRISQVDEQLNAELSAIDAQEQALNNSLDKRIISQSEFTKQQEILQNKRLEAEKKADKETRKLKRQQLIIDKTTALIEIGLDLQKAIAAYSANPITATLLPVIAGVITAALAAVSAVSIPAFKKGTKGKKGSGMALVGEQGPELTYLPTGAKVVPARQTKAYSELIDAMYDNNVDKYILKQYVAPRLEAQRRQYQDAKDQTFVKNIVNNMSYNGLSLSDQLYANSRGVAIKDKKELAEMVGKAVAENIPRPDPWRM